MKQEKKGSLGYRCLGCLRRDREIERLKSEMIVEKEVSRTAWDRVQELEEKLKDLQPDGILDLDRSLN